AVGVARAGAVLAEGVHRESRSHTASLPLLVERVLRDAGLALEDVEGIAVSIGPGSFTGLRIGLALAKGLAVAGGLPQVGVPPLEALDRLAEAAPRGSRRARRPTWARSSRSTSVRRTRSCRGRVDRPFWGILRSALTAEHGGEAWKKRTRS